MTPSATRKGFSLPELLVALTLGVLVITLALGMTLSGRRMLERDQARTSLNENLRIGADIMGDDIQNAGAGMTLTSSPLLLGNDLTLVYDADPDPVGETLVTLRYYLDAGYLMQSMNGAPGSPVVNNIKAMRLKARLDDGTLLNSVSTLGEWRNLSAIIVELDGEIVQRGEAVERTYKVEYFPRNVRSS